jgi:gluconolactonase
MWFNDRHHGFHQRIHPEPQLPSQVYKFDPKTHLVRAVADGFTRQNGLCFSPDLEVLYPWVAVRAN